MTWEFRHMLQNSRSTCKWMDLWCELHTLACRGRMTPVVSDIQLLPGRWERPSAPFVSHPLYASGTNNGESSGVPTSEEGGISGTREESSSISSGKRRRGEGECALSGTCRHVNFRQCLMLTNACFLTWKSETSQ